MLKQLGDVNISAFEQENPELSDVSFENITAKRNNFQENNMLRTNKKRDWKEK